jgi:hypothetical protein
MPSIRLQTLPDCALWIGRYPPFRYDASGGGGVGRMGTGPGPLPLHFDPVEISIPALESRTTRFLGLPLPPGLRIRITPELLEGELNPASGSLRLTFQARFHLSISSLYSAPDLLITTELTTGTVHSRRHRVEGQRRDGSGAAVLVGIDTVQPCGDPLLDQFLGLPDEALALMRCRLTAEEEPDPLSR